MYKNTESLLHVHVYMVSHFTAVQLFATLWIMACQFLLSVGFSRQEHWSGLPCPPPGNLPNPGMELISLTLPALTGRFLTRSATWEAPLRCMPKTDITYCKSTILQLRKKKIVSLFQYYLKYCSILGLKKKSILNGVPKDHATI